MFIKAASDGRDNKVGAAGSQRSGTLSYDFLLFPPTPLPFLLELMQHVLSSPRLFHFPPLLFPPVFFFFFTLFRLGKPRELMKRPFEKRNGCRRRRAWKKRERVPLLYNIRCPTLNTAKKARWRYGEGRGEHSNIF